MTGSYDDGPEWGTQPFTNMFASDHGSTDPKSPVNTLVGGFLKSHGGTVIGTYGYGISPSSAGAARGAADAFKAAGGKIGVLDTSIPFGGANFTSTALIAKQNGVDAMTPSMDNNSNFALATALKQAGVKLKAALFATGYQPDVINSPVWSTLQGDYFLSAFRPWSLPNAGTQQMQAAMEKYAHFSKTQIRDLRSDRIVARGRPHDQGTPDGRCQPHAGGRDQGPAQHQGVQRERAAADHGQLLDDLRSRPGELRLGREGGEDGVHADLVPAFLRSRHRGNDHTFRVGVELCQQHATDGQRRDVRLPRVSALRTCVRR